MQRIFTNYYYFINDYLNMKKAVENTHFVATYIIYCTYLKNLLIYFAFSTKTNIITATAISSNNKAAKYHNSLISFSNLLNIFKYLHRQPKRLIFCNLNNLTLL